MTSAFRIDVGMRVYIFPKIQIAEHYQFGRKPSGAVFLSYGRINLDRVLGTAPLGILTGNLYPDGIVI